MVSFDKFLDIIASAPRTIGIYPETKDPEWTNSEPVLLEANVTIEELVINALVEHGYTEPDGRCLVQTFGYESLLRLQQITNLPLIRLSNDMFSDEELDELSEICYGIGVSKSIIVHVDEDTNKIDNISNLIERTHQRGLQIHTYTMKNEATSLAFDYGQDAYEEYELFTRLDIDGMFTDFPSSMERFREWNNCQQQKSGGHTIRCPDYIIMSSILIVLVKLKIL